MITESEIQRELRQIDIIIPRMGKKYVPITTARIIAKKLIKEIKPYCYKIALVGSMWREHPTVGDLDILVVPRGSGSANELKQIKQFEGMQINIFTTTTDSWGASIIHWSLGRAIVHLKKSAKEKGLKLNRYGLWDGSKKIAGRNPEDIYKQLGKPLPSRPFPDSLI
jgi:DNA polymerase (family X)